LADEMQVISFVLRKIKRQRELKIFFSLKSKREQGHIVFFCASEMKEKSFVLQGSMRQRGLKSFFSSKSKREQGHIVFFLCL